jgi:hypothetical protein
MNSKRAFYQSIFISTKETPFQFSLFFLKQFPVSTKETPFQFSLFFLKQFPVSLLPLQLLQGTNLASPCFPFVTQKPSILSWKTFQEFCQFSRFIQLFHILAFPTSFHLINRQSHYLATNTICVTVTI